MRNTLKKLSAHVKNMWVQPSFFFKTRFLKVSLHFLLTSAKLSILCTGLIAVNLALASIGYGQSKLLKDAVAVWLFDEITKKKEKRAIVEVISDVTGNGHDARLLNEPKLRDGKFNMAMEFSQRRKSYLVVPDHEALQLTDSITILAWVKRPASPKDAAPYYILAKGNTWQSDSPAYGISLHKVFNNMFYFWYKGGFQGTDGIKDDQWHHYAVVAQSKFGDAVLYIDGELKPVKHRDGAKRVELQPTPEGRTINIHIGALTPGRFDALSDNTIDEVAIFKTALTQAEIRKLMAVGLDRGIYSVSPADKLATGWGRIKQKQ